MNKKINVDISKPYFCLYARVFGNLVPVVYAPDRQVLTDVSQAIRNLFSPNLSDDSKRDMTHHVIRFLNYIHSLSPSSPITIDFVSDSIIKAYRHSLLTAKKGSINVYIRTIYRFIANYYLLNPELRKGMIGSTSNDNVRSGCFDKNGNFVTRNAEMDFYPLLYKTPKRKAGLSLKQDQIPTDSDFIDLIKAIDARQTSIFIKERDKLIVEFARNVGFRRISICSLNASTFDDISEAFEEGYMMVTPPRQKYGYQLSFRVNYTMALKTQGFIQNVLKPFLDDKKLRLNWSGKIFINENGKDMRLKYLTQHISSIAKSLGWPKGKVLHAFRHTFAISECDEIYHDRLKSVKDPHVARSMATVMLKDKLGHLSESSQDVYLTHAENMTADEYQKKRHESERLKISEQARKERELIRYKLGYDVTDLNIYFDDS
ncbi:TPA: hypothetical protein ACX6QO_001018 [Photobacterium damselae]